MSLALKLPPRWTEYLLTQPETGMGYQRVALKLKDGRTIRPAVVLNVEQLQVEEPVSLRPQDIVEITVER
jgi:hypothetical protein